MPSSSPPSAPGSARRRRGPARHRRLVGGTREVRSRPSRAGDVDGRRPARLRGSRRAPCGARRRQPRPRRQRRQVGRAHGRARPTAGSAGRSAKSGCDAGGGGARGRPRDDAAAGDGRRRPALPLPSPADVDCSMEDGAHVREAVRPFAAQPLPSRTPHPRHPSLTATRFCPPQIRRGTWFFNVRVSVGGLSYTLTRAPSVPELHTPLSALGLLPPRSLASSKYCTRLRTSGSSRPARARGVSRGGGRRPSAAAVRGAAPVLGARALARQIERGAGSRGMDRATRRAGEEGREGTSRHGLCANAR